MRGLFGSMFRSETKADEAFGAADDIWRELFGGAATRSGARVSWKTALEVTTVLRCASIIAEGICSVPWKLYQRVEENKKTVRSEARSHALWDLISVGPNDFQTSFEFREQIGFHLALCQNAYVFVNRVRGKIVELIPLEPNHVSVERRSDWSLHYRVTGIDGAQEVFPAATIWHIKGRSWNGYEGLETIRLAREAVGLALSTEETHARFHANSVRPSGILSVEGALDENDYRQYRRWIEKRYQGVSKTGGVIIADKAAKWQSTQMSGIDAEHLATRGFQIEENCRAMGVLPIMVGYSGDKSITYASAEQMFIAHNTHTTRPWHRRIEGSADKWLLTRQERAAGHYFGFVDSELVRGDIKTRYEAYKSAIDAGWMLPEEPRGFEEMPYVEGLSRPRAPLNSGIVGPDGTVQAPKGLARGGPPAKPEDPAE